MLGLSYEQRSSFRSERYSVQGSNSEPKNGASSPTVPQSGFPSHFYPQKQQWPALSPRQAEAVQRLAPKKMGNSLVPDFPSEHREGGQTKAQASPGAAQPNQTTYKEFIAAPVSPKPFGNYPELKNVQLYRGPSNISTPMPVEQQQKPETRPQQVQQVHQIQPAPQLQQESVHEQPNATMETKVSGQGQPKRVGRWTLAQLRQTDGIIPSQAGWNKGDSQKLMTNFGTPRNTKTGVKAENLKEIPEDVLMRTHGEVRLQSGTNKYASQRGMTNFGSGRDVCRESVRVNQNPTDLPELPEEKIRLSEGIVRLQAGTNKYDSQKGMTCMGTARRETTRIKDTARPDYDHERPDQSEIPLQSGTNKFASQKGMTCMGTNRRETCRIVDTAHPDYNPESSIDSSTIPLQMGTNKYASQKGMTSFGQGRWEVLDPSISWQNRKSQGMVRLQSGTNRFASQAGMTGFGTIRNTTYEAEAGELPYEDMKKSETIIPSQAGWNRGDSQKNMTCFGASRDVKGKHLKRIWELEYPEEAEISLDRL
ncbi:unnamed protein product, partial [Mesorhabditis spiculigera]